MKKSILAMLAVLISGTLYLKSEPFSSGNYRIFDENQQCVGHIQKSPFKQDRHDCFDKDWKRKGSIEKQDSDRWDFESLD